MYTPPRQISRGGDPLCLVRLWRVGNLSRLVQHESRRYLAPPRLIIRRFSQPCCGTCPSIGSLLTRHQRDFLFSLRSLVRHDGQVSCCRVYPPLDYSNPAPLMRSEQLAVADGLAKRLVLTAYGHQSSSTSRARIILKVLKYKLATILKMPVSLGRTFNGFKSSRHFTEEESVAISRAHTYRGNIPRKPLTFSLFFRHKMATLQPLFSKAAEE